MAQQDLTDHLDPHTMAELADRSLDPAGRARAVEHLADCRECRDELAEVTRLVQTAPVRRRSWLVPAAAAAAAAVIFVVSLPGPRGRTGAQHVTREPALTLTAAPEPIAPRGGVSLADSISWTSVPGATRYRLTLYGSGGDVLWQTLPADTAVAIPDSLGLTAGGEYYWQVKTETAHGRWVESELVPFTLSREAPLP